jgi:hypothetical protein
MDRRRAGWLLGALVWVLGGCAAHRVPLTYALKQEQGLTVEELMSLQYYVSHDLVLRRELRAEGGRGVTGKARLLKVDVRQAEVLHLRAGTPGVAVAAGPDWVAVRFERGNAVLRFRAPDKPPEKDPKQVSSTVFAKDGEEIIVESPKDAWQDSYKLAALGWTFHEASGFQGRVLYDEKEFSVGDNGARTHLLIDQEAFTRLSTMGRVMPGVLLPGAAR